MSISSIVDEKCKCAIELSSGEMIKFHIEQCCDSCEVNFNYGIYCVEYFYGSTISNIIVNEYNVEKPDVYKCRIIVIETNKGSFSIIGKYAHSYQCKDPNFLLKLN